jgi:hypothetical protein
VSYKHCNVLQHFFFFLSSYFLFHSSLCRSITRLNIIKVCLYIKIVTNNFQKNISLGNIVNVARSCWLSLFMGSTGKSKPPSTPPSTGLGRMKHLVVQLWKRHSRRCVNVSTYRWSWNFKCNMFVFTKTLECHSIV